MSDICLILEGTYPYVTGGVSNWLHELITALDEFTFDIITLIPNREYSFDIKYKIPPNVKKIEDVYLQDINENDIKFKMSKKKRRLFFNLLWKYMENFNNREENNLPEILQIIENTPPSVGDILKSYEGWQFLLKIYNNFYSKTSFVDFFWTFRFMVLPFIALLQVKKVEAKCYHTICTGYAGFLSSILKGKNFRPQLLTEHGIYTKERLIEIIDADWIHTKKIDTYDLSRELSPLKVMWIKMFEAMGSITYENSEKIITLYGGNQKEQIKFGADPEKCMIIPNGVDPSRFKLKRKSVSSGPAYNVGYVGRVVPIKDIKTLIRAARLVIDKLPGCIFSIMGPTDEDPEYFLECKSLVEILNLKDNFKFLGAGDVTLFYPSIDLLILSSVSEAQPLVILEAHLCDIPVVSTNVGCAEELLYGRDKEDKKLGKSGIVVSVSDSVKLALATIEILTDSQKNMKMGKIGHERTLKYYTKEKLMESYTKLYREAISWQE